ncbi:MAG: PAS domain S-box protein [Syntrophomonas sp.]
MTDYGQMDKEQLLAEVSKLIKRVNELEDYRKREKVLKAKLSVSERYYRAIFDTTGTAMAIVEENATISLANNEFESLTGYSKREIEYKKNLTDFVIEEDRERIKEYHRLRRTDAGAPRKYEFNLLARDETVRNILITIDLIPKTQRSVASMLDITEKKEAENKLQQAYNELEDRVRQRTIEITRINELLQEENMEHEITLDELRNSEQILRSFVNAISESAFLMDNKGKILLVNEITAQRLGYEADEIVGKYLYDFLDTDIAGIRKQKANEVITSGQPVSFEDAPNGLSMWNSIYPVFDRKGRITSLATFGYDISEVKKMEEEKVRAAVERAAIIDAMGDGLLLMDMDGKIIDMNPALERMVRLDRELMLGNNFLEILPQLLAPGDVDKTVKIVASTLKGRVPPSEILTLITRNRSYLYFISTASFVYDDYNRPRNVILTFRNVTPIKKAEDRVKQTMEELRRSNEELQQFAYVASHDLQEPLRMVTSFVQLLANRYRGRLDEEADEFINFAVDGARRMQHLIQDLLSYARVESKGREFSECDAGYCLGKAVFNLQKMIEENNAIIINCELPPIRADEGQITQLFQNLIDNAIKFRGVEPPKIYITAEKLQNEWLFSVQDNGIGIEPDYAERIFIIFQRLHSRKDFTGTGIGLSICKKIIQRHNGRIWVESQAGEGSTFFFTIPDRRQN